MWRRKLRILSLAIPDEWMSAYRAFCHMRDIAKQTPFAVVKLLTSLAVPFFVGAMCSLILPLNIPEGFVNAYLASVGVLSGFVVTLMLFGGVGDGTEDLRVDQAERYGNIVLYLLVSQTITLACFVASLAVGTVWLLAEASPVLRVWLAPVIYGTAGLSVVRLLLLPAQIYDRHLFIIESMKEQKRKARNAELDQQSDRLAAMR